MRLELIALQMHKHFANRQVVRVVPRDVVLDPAPAQPAIGAVGVCSHPRVREVQPRNINLMYAVVVLFIQRRKLSVCVL